MPERRAGQRISRLAVLGIAVLGLAGCGAGPRPEASPSTGAPTFLDLVRASSPAKQLRFRPVLGTAEGASTGTPPRERDRQSTDPAVQQRTLRSFACGSTRPDPLTGEDDADLPLVTCARSGGVRYLLGPAVLDGSAIKSAGLGEAQGNTGFAVEVTFTPDGSAKWAELTAKNVGKTIAIVVGAEVIIAPYIQQAMPGGRAQISGWFSLSEAEDIVDWLDAQ
ncbi:precorrin-3B C(17)-methyltransferase [Amycolatopsis sp. NPDC059090]|uniref:SecDF P1 head subdomain-containing protein n=1 Tax=unclassified Amycolatopsis TaxID=2618356 RepID=UPI003671F587